MTSADERLLDRARRWGVTASYDDYRGERRSSPLRTLQAILDAMGADSDRPPDAGPIVAILGEAVDVSAYVELETEDGGGEPIRGSLPEDVPPGYHRLIDSDGRGTAFILSPGCCFLPRDLQTWGWGVQLYAARSRRSWGIGDTGDLIAVATQAAELGAGVVLLNPLHASIPTAHQQASPYFPSSRCFRNPLYIDIDRLNEGRELVEDFRRAAVALNERRVIDRDEVYRLKMGALTALWRSAGPSARFQAYRRRHGELLHDFSTFCALAETYGGGRSSFPAELAHARASGVERFAEANAERIEFHAWLQFVLRDQLEDAAGRIGLIHDLAIGVDPDGADAWLWPDVFLGDVKVGAPPDEFNSQGQDWGLPPFDPWRLRAHDYEPFIRTVRAGMAPGSGLRVDHVMGLFRLFWIPAGAGPREGAYVRYPHRDLLNILALESHRAEAFVIGEDLGTVEPSVREEMASREMLSYRIMWFEPGPSQGYPPLALAAITNHDLPTIAGMWTGVDLSEQERLGLEPNVEATREARRRIARAIALPDDTPVEQVIVALHERLASAPSAVVIATLDDALAVERRPNMPGTTHERPNWSIALPVPVEELGRQPLVRSLAAALGAR